MRTAIILAMIGLLASCAHGAESLYEREALMPAYCRAVNPMTLEQVTHAAGVLAPGVPVMVVFSDKHDDLRARRIPVTGEYEVRLVAGWVSGMWVAHELAHVAVMDAYRNTAPFGEPSTEGYVKMHGKEFVAVYKSFLQRLTSAECAAAL